MQITIDLNILRVHQLTADDYCYLFLLYHGKFELISSLDLNLDHARLSEDGWITEYQGKQTETYFYKIADKAVYTLFNRIGDHVNTLAKQMIVLFSKVNPERISTPQLIEDRLKTFMQSYSEYSPETIIKATEYFLNKDMEKQFIPEIHNFIATKLYAFCLIVSSDTFSVREFNRA